MSKIIQEQLNVYRPNFLKYGNTPKGTFQNNIETQFERFRNLINPLLDCKADGFSICDVGSGLSDLHLYINQNDIVHNYTGIEIVPEMVAEAKKRYPNARILNVDFLSDDFSETHDFYVLSGTFNIPGQIATEEWEKFIFDTIAKMYKLSNIGISFNTLTCYSTFFDDNLYYPQPEKIFGFLQNNLSRFCMLNTMYPLYEVSYTVLKPSFLKERYTNNAFDKYFKNI